VTVSTAAGPPQAGFPPGIRISSPLPVPNSSAFAVPPALAPRPHLWRSSPGACAGAAFLAPFPRRLRRGRGVCTPGEGDGLICYLRAGRSIGSTSSLEWANLPDCPNSFHGAWPEARIPSLLAGVRQKRRSPDACVGAAMVAVSQRFDVIVGGNREAAQSRRRRPSPGPGLGRVASTAAPAQAPGETRIQGRLGVEEKSPCTRAPHCSRCARNTARFPQLSYHGLASRAVPPALAPGPRIRSCSAPEPRSAPRSPAARGGRRGHPRRAS
jgi:hypothetical protein